MLVSLLALPIKSISTYCRYLYQNPNPFNSDPVLITGLSKILKILENIWKLEVVRFFSNKLKIRYEFTRVYQ